MSEETKLFIKLPTGLAEMSDAEIDELATAIFERIQASPATLPPH